MKSSLKAIAFVAFISAGSAVAQTHETECDNLLVPVHAITPLGPHEIHYQISGPADGDPLVLIHGLDSSTATFEPIIAPLSEKHLVIAFDQRGHGKSAAKGTDYSTHVMAADLLSLLDHLGIEKAHVLGHSMGARSALRFAALHPERVKSIVIEDMEMQSRTEYSPEKFEKILARSEAARRGLEERQFDSRADLIEALRPFFGRESESLSYRRAKENPDGSMTLLFRPSVSFLYGYLGNTEDFTQELKELQVPLLVLRSDPNMGSAISDEGAEHLQRTQPGALVETFDGAGHVIHRSHREAFLDILGEFLREGGLSPESRGKYEPKMRSAGSVDLDSILIIADERARVAELSRLHACELDSAQTERLIALAPSLTNSYEIGQYLRIAKESASVAWLPALDSWISNWQGSSIGWQGHMRNTAFNTKLEILGAETRELIRSIDEDLLKFDLD